MTAFCRKFSLLLNLLMAGCGLSVWGCAVALEPSEEDPDDPEKDPDDPQKDPDDPQKDPDDPQKDPDDPQKPSTDVKVGDKCPSEDYAKCSGSNLLTCKSGKIASQKCSDGCSNGACASGEYEKNSCSNPYVVEEGSPKTGKTLTDTSYESVSCSGDSFQNRMAVFKLNVKDNDKYRINVSGGKSWGYILAHECDVKNEVYGVCFDQNADSIVQYLAQGEYYLFVAPLSDSKHFEAQVSFSRESAGEYCSYSGPLDPIFFNGKDVELSGAVSDSNASYKIWEMQDECGHYGVQGIEHAYLLTVFQESALDIKLNIDEGAEGVKYVLHTLNCGQNRETVPFGTPRFCSDGLAATSVQMNKTFAPGEYVLIVDSSSTQPFKYHLNIKSE